MANLPTDAIPSVLDLDTTGVRLSSEDMDYRINCPCCGLVHKAVYGQHGVKEPVCADCRWHQGTQPDKRVARAEKHEELLRARLTACRDSERAAQKELAEAREAVKSALRSRGRLAEDVVDAAGRCRSGCAVLRVINPQVERWAARSREEDLHW